MDRDLAPSQERQIQKRPRLIGKAMHRSFPGVRSDAAERRGEGIVCTLEVVSEFDRAPASTQLDPCLSLGCATRVLDHDVTTIGGVDHPGVALGVPCDVGENMTDGPPRQQRRMTSHGIGQSEPGQAVEQDGVRLPASADCLQRVHSA
jgi:hypothetical protein